MSTTCPPGTRPQPGATLAISAVAAQLRSGADEVRLLTRRCGAAGAAPTWRSPAATAFHGELEATARALLRCAELLDHAADTATAHARTAAHREAELGAIEYTAARVGGAVLHWLVR